MEYLLQISINIVVLTGVYSLLALGFNLLYSHNKFFDLSYAAYMLVGAYSYLFINEYVGHALISFVLSVIASIIFSLVIEKFLYRRLREKKSSGVAMMITSLGILTVTQALIAILFTSNIQTLASGSQSISWSNAYITYLQIAILIISLAFYCAIYSQKIPHGVSLGM